MKQLPEGLKWDTESPHFRVALRNKDVSAEEVLVIAIGNFLKSLGMDQDDAGSEMIENVHVTIEHSLREYVYSQEVIAEDKALIDVLNEYSAIEKERTV